MTVEAKGMRPTEHTTREEGTQLAGARVQASMTTMAETVGANATVLE